MHQGFRAAATTTSHCWGAWGMHVLPHNCTCHHLRQAFRWNPPVDGHLDSCGWCYGIALVFLPGFSHTPASVLLLLTFILTACVTFIQPLPLLLVPSAIWSLGTQVLPALRLPGNWIAQPLYSGYECHWPSHMWDMYALFTSAHSLAFQWWQMWLCTMRVRLLEWTFKNYEGSTALAVQI